MNSQKQDLFENANFDGGIQDPNNWNKQNDGQTVAHKHAKQKKKQTELYNEVDMAYFNSRKPKNLTSFIDRKTQKITINPGMPYISASQNEIFEIRSRTNYQT